jgi:hypothetical protein
MRRKVILQAMRVKNAREKRSTAATEIETPIRRHRQANIVNDIVGTNGTEERTGIENDVVKEHPNESEDNYC